MDRGRRENMKMRRDRNEVGKRPKASIKTGEKREGDKSGVSWKIRR